ncbi:centrosomal protein of 135 kDa isoform X2 [Salmo salar]|uniref:Centrosomal protein of 135 kDa isoform X2 n=1 Tax=Salmo salar TaxID=8030 RepID=A0ABM3EDE8_SALSA|nr:centrosomal protein of 135 kDa-like isoform X2 [Salmo salar]
MELLLQYISSGGRVAAVCLGLLCVLLLTGIIGLSVYYGVIGHHDSTERDQLQASYSLLTKEGDQLQTSYSLLTKERDQLQTSYSLLTKERDQLQTSYSLLTKERNQLQTSSNTLTKERDQQQTSSNTLTKERDQQQTSSNTLTKERDQQQKEKNDLMRKFSNLKQTCPKDWKKFESSWYFLSTETKTRGRAKMTVWREEQTW